MAVINIQNVDLKEVEVDSDIIFAEYNEENGKLTLHTQLQPAIIDSNFDELEGMFHHLRSELEAMKLSVQKLENKVNVLQAIKP